MRFPVVFGCFAIIALFSPVSGEPPSPPELSDEEIADRLADLERKAESGEATPVEVALFKARVGAEEGKEVEPVMSEVEASIVRETRRIARKDKGAALSNLLLEMDDHPHPGLEYLAGTMYVEREEWKEATTWFRKALAAYPDFLKARRSLASVLVKLERWDEAKQQLLVARELEPEPTDFVSGLLGLCYLKEGEYPTAQCYYQTAVDIDPKRQWRLGLAQALLGQKRFAEAVPVLESLRAEELALTEPADGSGDGAARLDSNPKPQALQLAFAAPEGVEGAGFVLAEFLVTYQGKAIDAKALESSDPRLIPPTLAAIRASRWEPAVADGKPVSVRVRQRFVFGEGSVRAAEEGGSDAATQ